jgi:hypothetical protein
MKDSKRSVSHGTAGMRVEISSEETHLEKEHTSSPDTRRAAKVRKHHLREHGLEEEQRRGTNGDRHNEREAGDPASSGHEAQGGRGPWFPKGK